MVKLCVRKKVCENVSITCNALWLVLKLQLEKQKFKKRLIQKFNNCQFKDICIALSLQMITKTKDCADVHELCLSTEEFQRKERNKESIYSGSIHNRRVSNPRT